MASAKSEAKVPRQLVKDGPTSISENTTMTGPCEAEAIRRGESELVRKNAQFVDQVTARLEARIDTLEGMLRELIELRKS